MRAGPDPLDGLDGEQRAAAEAVSGPVAIIAGAGTGKTRAITHRIAHAVNVGAHDPARSLAVTFTTRAAGEMRTRLGELGVAGVQVRTFHAAALSQLRYFWPSISARDFPQLMASKAKLVAEAASRVGLAYETALMRDLASDIEWCKAVELPFDRAQTDPRAAGRAWATDLPRVVAVAEAYEDLKQERGLLDFEDVLLVTVGALEREPGIARKVQQTYRWFTVDEFQDVSPLQHHLLSLWLGDGEEVCVVGDANQTIYGFSGATARYLEGFEKRYPGATSIRLVNCYRCTPQIVQVANAVGSKGTGTVQLRPVRPVGPVPSLDEYADDVAEAAAVADAIAALRREGMPAREIAVLFRVNAQSEELEAALAQRGIPVVLRGAERFFDRPEVKEAVTRLRGAARAGESGADLAAEVRAVLSGAGWTPDPPSSTGAQRERWESLAALVDLADERASALQEQPSPLRAFIDELDARAQLQHAPQADGVTLASLHAAKGLEWDAVFIVGCSEGLLPLTHATTAAQIEEERRLCYVGVTRAREQLRLSWAASRQPGGRANRSPSRFLAGVLSDGEGHGGTARGSVKRGTATRERKVRRGPAKCAVCGKALVTGRERTIGRCRTCPSGADERLFDQLKAWRLAEATTRAVPAYVIFTDATLEALASRRPSSIDELADVPGIGPAKLERYAQQLLDLLR